MNRALKLFSLLFITTSLFSQTDFNKIHALKNISTQRVYSQSVEDSFYVYTKLPDGYNDSTKSYPVLYVMDGDLIFPITCGIAQYLYYGEYIPEVIIVSIGYGTIDWQNGNQRSRDYTAIATEGRPFEGGAPEYLKFITDELIPIIDKQYRTNKSERILMGHSLGGQFVLYAMLSSPQTFTKYIASSPFIFRLKDYYHNLLDERIDEINKYNNRVFISAGENELEEEYLSTIGEFVDKLKKQLTLDTKMTYKKLPEGEHFLNPSTALTFGLKWLFEN